MKFYNKIRKSKPRKKKCKKEVQKKIKNLRNKI